MYTTPDRRERVPRQRSSERAEAMPTKIPQPIPSASSCFSLSLSADAAPPDPKPRKAEPSRHPWSSLSIACSIPSSTMSSV